MFNADPRTKHRIAQQIERVLIIDPVAGSHRLLGELMKEMGARHTMVAATSERAKHICADFNPQIILTEFAASELDGLEFTQWLRRSNQVCRQAPVIMVTAEATAASIIGARNSGVHEFLRKPFTAGDLYRRVENVMLKPRPWIQAQAYVGPDRRRFNSGEFDGAKKRRSDSYKMIGAAQAS